MSTKTGQVQIGPRPFLQESIEVVPIGTTHVSERGFTDGLNSCLRTESTCSSRGSSTLCSYTSVAAERNQKAGQSVDRLLVIDIFPRVSPHEEEADIGSITVHIGGIDYFYFYGAYYRWIPEHKAYEVVEPPEERPRSDVLRLVNGEVLHGQFLEADENSIEFAVGDEIHHVALTEVVSLELEPPSEDDGEGQ